MKRQLCENHIKGQSILEILIALGVLAVSVSAATFLFLQGQSFTIDTAMSQNAIYLARQFLDQARQTAKANFAGLGTSSTTTGGFLEETIVTSTDAYSKKVTARLSWDTTSTRPQKVEFTTIVTNWPEIAATGGDTGGGGLSGDWTNPRTLGSVDVGPGNSATDLDVKNKIVYLSAEAADPKKPDFYIVDAVNGSAPSIISSLDTGSGLNTIDTAGEYAYVGTKDTNGQLQIIDVSNPANPQLVKSFKLNGVSGSGAVGQSIFYNSSKIYMGTKKATGPEFHIIDVTDPLNPVESGSREIDENVNDIYVKEGTAYLATSDEEEVKVLNVENPSNITQIGGFDAPGESEDGKSLYLASPRLYLGRLVGGNHVNHHELHVLDISNPASVQNLGSKDLATGVNGIVTRDYLVFLATSDSNKEFQIWNASNPANITFWVSFNFPQVATGIDYEDNIVYVSVRSNDALRIITSSP